MRSPDLREPPEQSRELPLQEGQMDRGRDGFDRLHPDDLHALKVVGAFRAVNRRDVAEGNVERLISRGWMKSKTVFPRRGGERHEVVVLSRKGRELLLAQQAGGDAQRYYAGLAKPNEIEHDMAIYAAFREQAAAIEKSGGKVQRVVLDYEFKSHINRQMNRREGASPEERRQQLASEFELPVVNDRLALPDLRIEYSDAEGREQHLDIEVVTRHYRGAHRAGKARSGFQLVNANSPRASVLDDHHLGFWG